MRCPAHPWLHGKLEARPFHSFCGLCGLTVVHPSHYRDLMECCGDPALHLNRRTVEGLVARNIKEAPNGP
jgi:hypothetical protein